MANTSTSPLVENWLNTCLQIGGFSYRGAKIRTPWQLGKCMQARFISVCSKHFPSSFNRASPTNKVQSCCGATRVGFPFCVEVLRRRHCGRTAALRLTVQPCDEDDSFVLVMAPARTQTARGNPPDPGWGGGGTCPSATLSTTNPTWTGQGSNPGLSG
jgi:hypothetical protein